MTSILSCFYEYFKINQYALFLIVFLAALSCFKYLPIKISLSNRSILLGIIIVGTILRLTWLGYSSHRPLTHWDIKPMQENDLINVHAIELTKGIWFHDAQGHPSGRRPIGYPMFLGLVYKIFGTRLEVAWTANLLLSIVTALFIFLMAKTIFDERTGLLATLLFSIYPISIYSVKLITDEHLFLPVWYAGLYLLFQEIKGKRLPLGWLWYGLIFGYATMIRTHTIFMPLTVGFAYLLVRRPPIQVLRTVFLTFLVMQLVNLPWVIRNYKAWGVPVLYTATGAFVYSQLNSVAPPTGGGHIPARGEPGFSGELEKAFQSGNEGRIHQISNREMKHWILTHPKEFTILSISRLLSFMNWNRKSGVWALWHQFYEGAYDPNRPLPPNIRKTLEEFAFVFYYILFYSTLLSIFLLMRRWPFLPEPTKICLGVLGSCFLFWFMEHMIIYPDRKYRFPLEPLMLIVACYFYEYLLSAFRWESFRESFRQFKSKHLQAKSVAP